MVLQVVVVFALTVVAATLSYWLIERPINRGVRRAQRSARRPSPGSSILADAD
jgi:peptidoglycan/LPS O-acetylase OafA/YrhL